MFWNIINPKNMKYDEQPENPVKTKMIEVAIWSWGEWSNLIGAYPYTLWQTNIVMEHGPFEDVSPVRKGGFPLLC